MYLDNGLIGSVINPTETATGTATGYVEGVSTSNTHTVVLDSAATTTDGITVHSLLTPSGQRINFLPGSEQDARQLAERHEQQVQLQRSFQRYARDRLAYGLTPIERTNDDDG